MKTVQTSAAHRGQVYVPAVNWFLLACCLGLVFTFGSSTRLAAAYGVAVTLTMVITTILIASIARDRWQWSTAKIVVVLAPLFAIDLAFAGANIFKIPAGGWLPLVIGAAGFVIFTTWWKGRHLVIARVEREGLSVETFVAGLGKHPPHRHIGTAVYLHRTAGLVPPALLANLRHNDSLHDDVVFVSVTTADAPHVLPARRERVTHHGLGFNELEMRYGFNDQPRLTADLQSLEIDGLSFKPDSTTYFLGRERITAGTRPGMSPWRDRLYAFLHRNASDPAAAFGLPPDRTVDIGVHIEI